MASILKKAAKYRRISAILIEGEAHLKDPFIQPPLILKPPTQTKAPSPDDISDFPRYKNVPIPESIPYMEGKYRPASLPFVSGNPYPKIRLVPIQHLLAGRESVLMVFMRLESNKPQLRRFMQRQHNKMQTSDFQRIRKRILQVVQLQKLSKRSILQRYSQGHDQSVSQVTQRILRNLGRNRFLFEFRLHVLELVYLIQLLDCSHSISICELFIGFSFLCMHLSYHIKVVLKKCERKNY